jgi:hypothetical protein
MPQHYNRKKRLLGGLKSSRLTRTSPGPKKRIGEPRAGESRLGSPGRKGLYNSRKHGPAMPEQQAMRPARPKSRMNPNGIPRGTAEQQDRLIEANRAAFEKTSDKPRRLSERQKLARRRAAARKRKRLLEENMWDF